MICILIVTNHGGFVIALNVTASICFFVFCRGLTCESFKQLRKIVSVAETQNFCNIRYGMFLVFKENFCFLNFEFLLIVLDGNAHLIFKQLTQE